MKLFQKQPASKNWLAVVPQQTRLDVVRVEKRRDAKPRVVRCESYPLRGSLSDALAQLRQGGKLDGRCITLLGAGEYQFVAAEAPTLPDNAPAAELREAVRWKIKDMVEFPVAAAGVDAVRIPAAAGRPPQVLAAAASHVVLKPLIEHFQQAKVSLGVVTLPEIAQGNIAHLFETPDRALALLVFDKRGGLLTLTNNGTLYATRRLDTSADDLANDKQLYERTVLDIQRSLDNFDRNFHHLTLERLLVLPVPGADDFIAHLKDNLYQPVEALDIAAGLDISAAPMLAQPAALLDALPALGAALDADTPGLNLFDPMLQKQVDPWTSRNLGFGLGAAALLCAVWGGWAQWQLHQRTQEFADIDPQLQAAHDEVKQLNQQITGHKPDAALQASFDESRSILQARQDVLALLQKGLSPENGSPADWLLAFARQTPNGLWLTGFNINIETGALEIRGRTNDPTLIPEFVKRLNAEQTFRGRTFAALEISTPPADNATDKTAKATAPNYHEFALTSSEPGAHS